MKEMEFVYDGDIQIRLRCPEGVRVSVRIEACGKEGVLFHNYFYVNPTLPDGDQEEGRTVGEEIASALEHRE